VAARKKTTGARTRGGKAAKAGTSGSRGAGRGAVRGGARGAGAGRAAPSRFPEVEELVELMNRHELLEVDYQVAPDGSSRIRVSRAGAGHHAAAAPGGHAPRTAPLAAEAAPAAPAEAAAPPAGEALHAFKSPMVGTFYRAPSPEAPAFVSVGDRIDPHATVCIIEAMKVMNEITPDISGTVVSIEVENGEAVEFGQTLFLVRPN
jgi:acetyl-CoA carboxylase biotin carboxyl carrier protein